MRVRSTPSWLVVAWDASVVTGPSSKPCTLRSAMFRSHRLGPRPSFHHHRSADERESIRSVPHFSDCVTHTSFWLALRNRRDPHHSEAARLWQERGDAGLFTTNHVFGETWTLLRRKSGHASAVGCRDAIDRSPRVTSVHVTAELERQARLGYGGTASENNSFVDASSFAVMKTERIREAQAFDGDFSAAGFTELRFD